MSTESELLEQNRVLRERLALYERGAREPVDPLLRLLAENSPAFLTVITPEGRFVATGRTSETFGSVVGRSVFEFAPPDEHGRMREAYALAGRTRQPTTYESTGPGENGEPGHTYFVRVVPVVDGDGVSVLLLVPADITERVRLERSLALSEEKLRLAMDATGVGLWSWDFVRDEVRWDQRMLDIFGAHEAPKDYPTYLALLHPDDVALVRRNVEAALETGVYTPFEHRLAPRADGVERWVLGLGKVTRDASGKPTYMTGGALDITAQKSAAAQMQRAQRVESLGQLTAGLAHNFNNLLGVILPNLEMLLERAAHDQAPLVNAALDAALQARELIKRLLSLTAPRAVGAAAACDPGEVLERAAGIAHATFPREISLVTELAPDVGHVAMGASDLEQVVLNLLVNARDALSPGVGPERRIEILLDAVAGERQTRRARVRVRDNGVGMTPEIAARVFEPFFTTKPAHRGAGLGLADAVVRVRDAGGALDCESAPGHGATFTILLPVVPAPAPAEKAAAAAKRASDGETILIVDDEAMVRGAVGRLLSRRGYRVLEACDASQARELLAAKGAEVRLVLLDQSMPHESGPEALPSLKSLTEAPIVLFSGGNAELPPGAAALLHKPAQAAELYALIEELLARSKRG